MSTRCATFYFDLPQLFCMSLYALSETVESFLLLEVPDFFLALIFATNEFFAPDFLAAFAIVFFKGQAKAIPFFMLNAKPNFSRKY